MLTRLSVGRGTQSTAASLRSLPQLGGCPSPHTLQQSGRMLTRYPDERGAQLTASALQSLQLAPGGEQRTSVMMERYLTQEKWDEPRPGVSGRLGNDFERLFASLEKLL